MEKMRINKFLSQANHGSRRQCDGLIREGVVTVNGVVAEMGMTVDPDNDVVMIHGQQALQQTEKRYYVYHKARGTIVTCRDEQGRKTIYDALQEAGLEHVEQLKYVGRLDRDSEGVLLLTNDGSLVHAVTHPRFHIKKVYQVKVAKALSESDCEKLVVHGVESEGVILHAGALRYKGEENREHWYEVDLYEGKNRQIRRLFSAVGHEVLRLRRIQFANIKIRSLPLGAFRPLEEREVTGFLRKGYPTELARQSQKRMRTNT